MFQNGLAGQGLRLGRPRDLVGVEISQRHGVFGRHPQESGVLFAGGGDAVGQPVGGGVERVVGCVFIARTLDLFIEQEGGHERGALAVGGGRDAPNER